MLSPFLEAMDDLTPHADVNELVVAVSDGSRAVLGGDMVGMYLTGSLATGDYVPGRSDVDFVVVTDAALGDDHVEALRAMHERIALARRSRLPWIEGIYVPTDLWRRHIPGGATCHRLTVDGTFGVQLLGANWVIERALFPGAITVDGPPPQTLVDPVSDAEVAAAAREAALSWWPHTLEDVSLLPDEAHLVFAVLTMARAWFSAEVAAQATKTEAARWLADRRPEWATLLHEALAWRAGRPFARRDDVLALITATLHRLRQAP